MIMRSISYNAPVREQSCQDTSGNKYDDDCADVCVCVLVCVGVCVCVGASQ